MRLLEARALAKDWSGTPLFSDASFTIDSGEKIGLVGRNGSGKTSLLRILAGLDDDYSGSLVRPGGLRVGYVPQRYEPPAGMSVSDLLLAGAREAAGFLEAKGEELAKLEGRALERALADYAELRARYEALGAEEAPERAARLVERLGLGAAADREASLLSGGEKNVLALALVLMEEPDLLFLDEPGNHLDFAGLAWLEDFIRGERRALVLVSHNRWLLDRSVDRIIDIDRGRVSSFSGAWSAWRLEKLKSAAGEGRDWQADRKRIERLEALVARFAEIARSRADPAWGKRLRARRSQLEREKAQATKKPDLGGRGLKLSFDAEESKADFALIVRDYSKAYGDRVLFEGASLDLLAGERAAIVGPNGSGKTSLLRDIVAAAGSLDGGPLRVGPSMRVGYCAQGQEVFRPERSVGEEFVALGAREAETIKLLRPFLFGREVLEKKVAALSGGELNRLQIARAVWLDANFLILDEPTNHLDIESREAVEEALLDFQGAVLLVSHDRWFLEKVAERIVLVEGGKLLPYEGSFSEFWRDLGSTRGQRTAQRAPEDRAASIARSARAARRGSGPAPASADTRRMAELERRIDETEAKRETLERESAAAFSSRDFKRAGQLADEAAASSRLLDKLWAEFASLN
jgi:ATP-binding cassette subfamily F protein 3